MRQWIDWILHVDKHLRELMEAVGAPWLYTILFLIVFCETGLVVLPFLPGDSLLFATGSLCAIEGSPMNIWVLWPLLLLALRSCEQCYRCGQINRAALKGHYCAIDTQYRAREFNR